jgi:cell division protein FtsW (lipid II flippase)
VSADAILVRAWDGNSLTLFGVLYGIVVTVVGVVIAKASTVGLIVYAMVSLALLAILLLFFGQPVIGAMRWLIERGKRVPPWPFGRRFRRSS